KLVLFSYNPVSAVEQPPLVLHDRRNFDIDTVAKRYDWMPLAVGSFSSGPQKITVAMAEAHTRATPAEKELWIKKDANLSAEQKKWCRCVLDVGATQVSDACLIQFGLDQFAERAGIPHTV